MHFMYFLGGWWGLVCIEKTLCCSCQIQPWNTGLQTQRWELIPALWGLGFWEFHQAACVMNFKYCVSDSKRGKISMLSFLEALALVITLATLTIGKWRQERGTAMLGAALPAFQMTPQTHTVSSSLGMSIAVFCFMDIFHKLLKALEIQKTSEFQW